MSFRSNKFSQPKVTAQTVCFELKSLVNDVPGRLGPEAEEQLAKSKVAVQSADCPLFGRDPMPGIMHACCAGSCKDARSHIQHINLVTYLLLVVVVMLLQRVSSVTGCW